MDFSKVITFGLTDKQNKMVINAFPSKEYELIDTETYTDLIAIPCIAVIINAVSLNKDEYDILMSYYDEVCDGLYEKIFWIGEPLPSKKARKILKCYKTFEILEKDLKFLLLDACRKCKRSFDFSGKICDTIRILSEIRKKPGIKTKELAGIIERSVRTTERYIVALKVAGEYIAYDTKTKGWYLEFGKSFLMED